MKDLVGIFRCFQLQLVYHVNGLETQLHHSNIKPQIYPLAKLKALKARTLLLFFSMYLVNIDQDKASLKLFSDEIVLKALARMFCL